MSLTNNAYRRAMQDRFQQLEDQRQSILAEIGAAPADRSALPPRKGTWSAAQTVLHLSIVEEGALAYLEKKRSFGAAPKTTWSAALRLLLLRTALWLPVKYKAPRVVADVPPCTMAEAILRWQSVRERMARTLAEMPDEALDQALFKHPSAGKFGMVQGLRFIQAHVQRHRQQIRNALHAAP